MSISKTFVTSVFVNDNWYHAEGTAYANYSFHHGRMYMSNGDPGYPDEEEIEITEIDFKLMDENEENEITDKSILEEAEELICEELYDNFNYDEWS